MFSMFKWNDLGIEGKFGGCLGKGRTYHEFPGNCGGGDFGSVGLVSAGAVGGVACTVGSLVFGGLGGWGGLRVDLMMISIGTKIRKELLVSRENHD